MILRGGILSTGVLKTKEGLGSVSPPWFFRVLWSRVHWNSGLSVRCHDVMSSAAALPREVS